MERPPIRRSSRQRIARPVLFFALQNLGNEGGWQVLAINQPINGPAPVAWIVRSFDGASAHSKIQPSSDSDTGPIYRAPEPRQRRQVAGPGDQSTHKRPGAGCVDRPLLRWS